MQSPCDSFIANSKKDNGLAMCTKKLTDHDSQRQIYYSLTSNSNLDCPIKFQDRIPFLHSVSNNTLGMRTSDQQFKFGFDLRTF